MKHVVGIVNLHNTIDLGPLTKRRSIASTSFLSRYAFIDFQLSNFANSNITQIGILIREKPRSLFKHLGLGKEWSMNTKRGGITFMYNEQFANQPAYNHDINNLFENEFFIASEKVTEIVFAPAHILAAIDYRPIIDEHRRRGAKVTLVTTEVHNANETFIGSDFAEIDIDGIVTHMGVNLGDKARRYMSLGIYIINRETLYDLMVKARHTSAFFSLRDIITHLIPHLAIHNYTYQGFVRCVDSLAHYQQYSMELLNPIVFEQFLKPNWPIYTRTFDTPPTFYGPTASVKQSFIANGAQIHGKVINSVIGRDVYVSPGAVIENCVLMSRAHVNNAAKLKNVILDKESVVENVLEIEGKPDNPIVVNQGEKV